MPVSTICLLSLSVSLSRFLRVLHETSLRPLTVARVVRWVVHPTTLSRADLLSDSQSWDLLLILPAAIHLLPQPISGLILRSWMIQAGIPSKLLTFYDQTNARLLHPSAEDIPRLKTAPKDLRLAESSQNLELSNELNGWIQNYSRLSGAVSMLNLLAFNPGRKEQYMKYGRSFSESVGSSRGGVAKLVGKIVPGTCSDGCDEWEEASKYKAGTQHRVIAGAQTAYYYYP